MGEIARKFIVLVALAACAQLLVSPAALAAGLGRLNVLSSLGEPLRAEIELLSVQPSEVDSLVARLASSQAYRQANIELNGALLGVKFAIENRGPGQFVINLTSVQPMNEPFIDMLVELTWNAGRLVREYTFLLDPPQYRGGMVASVPPVEPPSVQASPVAPPPAAPSAEPIAPTSAPVRQAAKPAPAPDAAAPKPAGSYEVKRGDTLAKIAQQNRIEGVSLQQMLVALYKNNPDAFDGENMNRLRAGRILNLPDRNTAAAASEGEARSLVNAQSADYAKYRSSLGAAVASAPARPDTGRQASGRVGAPAPDKAAAKEAPKDQLRLSRPDDAKAGSKAAAASDDAAAKDKALKEANERIALLEKNIAAMKSQAGAQLQAQAAKGAPAAKPEAAKPEAAKPEAAKAPAPATKPEPAKPEAAKPEPAKPEPAKPEASKPEAAKAADAAAAPAGDAAKAPEAAAPAPKPKPKPIPPPPPPPETSFADQLLDDPMTLYGGGAVIVLLIGYAFYAVRKKRKQAAAAASSNIVGMAEPTFSGSMLASPGDSEESVQVQEASSGAEVQVATASAAAPAAESEEIDPVAEADVYMAYGRDAQAEEILKEALAKDPGRQAVQLKLLEIYANRKDGASFEAVAKDLHAATGGQGEAWGRAAALGMSIDSGNALYGGGVAALPAAGAEDTVVMQAMNLGAPAPDLVLDAEPADAAPAVDFNLDAPAPAVDFDLDAPAQAAAEAPAPEAPAADAAPAALDFDLDLGGDKPAEAAPVEAAPAEAPAADAGMSIDFELPSMDAAPAEAPAAPPPAAEAASDGGLSIDFDLGTPAAPQSEPEAAPALDLSGISFDLGTPDAGAAAAPDAQWQEVATKLDLAKAYQDMGDKDGARELLNEVLKEGDAAQQDQAKAMMEALG